MKKVILGLVVLVALMAAESNALFEKKTLTVFNVNPFNAPAKISVTYHDPCDHWSDTVSNVNSHEAHCGWYQFDAWIQLPSGQVQAQGLTYSKADSDYRDDVVVIYGPVGGKYYVSRTTDKK